MGPNLTRLFRTANTGKVEVHEGVDYVVAMLRAQCTDSASFRVDTVPNARKLALLWNHGEALIAALEDAAKVMQNVSGEGYIDTVKERVRTLLDQLEQEVPHG